MRPVFESTLVVQLWICCSWGRRLMSTVERAQGQPGSLSITFFPMEFLFAWRNVLSHNCGYGLSRLWVPVCAPNYGQLIFRYLMKWYNDSAAPVTYFGSTDGLQMLNQHRNLRSFSWIHPTISQNFLDNTVGGTTPEKPGKSILPKAIRVQKHFVHVWHSVFPDCKTSLTRMNSCLMEMHFSNWTLMPIKTSTCLLRTKLLHFLDNFLSLHGIRRIEERG